MRPEHAQAYLLATWEIARPHELIEGFDEHHGLLEDAGSNDQAELARRL